MDCLCVHTKILPSVAFLGLYAKKSYYIERAPSFSLTNEFNLVQGGQRRDVDKPHFPALVENLCSMGTDLSPSCNPEKPNLSSE